MHLIEITASNMVLWFMALRSTKKGRHFVGTNHSDAYFFLGPFDA
jgi:hypothetical protein